MKGITPVNQEQQTEENENVGKGKQYHSGIGQRRLTQYYCKNVKKILVLCT